MRHSVSRHQLVLWPRHEITELWAPTGITNSPLTAEDDHTEGQEDAEPTMGGVTSALRCVHGQRCPLRARIGHRQPYTAMISRTRPDW
jgi:hypothetical protein